ncbi:MAG: amidase, partial [Rhodospirillaceae bacterium]|nr:amidase [Rhodospirillaceae bacterium]
GQTWAEFGPQLARYDAFLCPTVGSTEIAADVHDWVDPITVDGVEHDVNKVIMTFLFNGFSRCPALSVPSGLSGDGVPTGIQIVGNPYDDKSVFRVAQTLEGRVDFGKIRL